MHFVSILLIVLLSIFRTSSGQEQITVPDPGEKQIVPDPGEEKITVPDPGQEKMVPDPGQEQITVPDPGQEQIAPNPDEEQTVPGQIQILPDEWTAILPPPPTPDPNLKCISDRNCGYAFKCVRSYKSCWLFGKCVPKDWNTEVIQKHY